MALQPEKIVFFFLLELVFLRLVEIGKSDSPLPWGNWRPSAVQRLFFLGFLVLTLLGTSLGYSLTRFSKRFYAFKAVFKFLSGKDISGLAPMQESETALLTLPTLKGMTLPITQAEDLKILQAEIHRFSSPGEKVLMFPELGIYNFIFDRPFWGRFPYSTFAWIKNEWYAEFIDGLRADPPRLVVVDKDPGPNFPRVYFTVSENRTRYEETLEFIRGHYDVAGESPSAVIYRLKTQ